MCALCFFDVCTFILQKGCVFGTLLCVKNEQNSIRIPFFHSFFFFFLFCMTLSMSIALDNYSGRKKKKLVEAHLTI